MAKTEKRSRNGLSLGQIISLSLVVTLAAVGGTIGILIGNEGTKESVLAATVQATERLAMASVSPLSSDSSSWYCNWYLPGQGGINSASVLLANTSSKILKAQVISYVGTSSQSRNLVIPAHSFLRYPETVTPTAQSGAMSFIADGGGTVAELEVKGPLGSSVAPCNSSPSANWVALGANTLTGSNSGISVFNPFSQDAVIDVSLTSESHQFAPGALQGMVVASHQVENINLTQYFAGKKDVGVSVSSRIGRVVVGGLVQRNDAGDVGLSALTTSPAPNSQWHFPIGELSSNQAQQLIVYNPNSYKVDVTAKFSYLNLEAVKPSTSATTSTTSTTSSSTSMSTRKSGTSTTTTSPPDLGSMFSATKSIGPHAIGVIPIKSVTSIQLGHSYQSTISVAGGRSVVAAEQFVGSVANPNSGYELVPGLPLVTQHWIALYDPSALGTQNAQAWIATVHTGKTGPVSQRTPLVDLGPTYLSPPGKAPAALPLLQAQTAKTSKSVLKPNTHLKPVGELAPAVTGLIVSSADPFALGTVMGPTPGNWYVVPVLPFAN